MKNIILIFTYILVLFSVSCKHEISDPNFGTDGHCGPLFVELYSKIHKDYYKNINIIFNTSQMPLDTKQFDELKKMEVECRLFFKSYAEVQCLGQYNGYKQNLSSTDLKEICSDINASYKKNSYLDEDAAEADIRHKFK